MLPEHAEFNGFPAEGLQFLQDLVLNNRRDWFQPRKEVYERTLVAPARAFVASLGERLKTLSAGIEYDILSGSGGSILRIHRDVRFSKNKEPYHTNLRMVFWEGPLKRMENPGFFIVVEPAGAGIFAGQHQFSPAYLKAYREAVTDERRGTALEDAISEVKASGETQVGGSFYKKVPQGYNPDHERTELLKYSGLYVSSEGIPPQLLLQPALVEACFEHCHSMAPLHRWLVSLWESVSN